MASRFPRVAAGRFIRAAAAIAAVVPASAALVSHTASAAVVEFSNDLGGFIAAAGHSGVAVSFDDITSGADIGGQTIAGATFVAVGSALDVVDASTTATTGVYLQSFDATNALAATSGANVLSPGGATLGPGPDAAVEDDDVQIVFTTPVGYFGFDHLSQRADGNSFTRVRVTSTGGDALLDTIITVSSRPPAGESGITPGGSDFWGIVSDANDIASITFDEVDQDANAPDNNIGYDSLRFGAVADAPPPPIGVPLPSALAATPLLLGVAEVARRLLYCRRRVRFFVRTTPTCRC